MSVKNFYLTRINNNWLIFLKSRKKNRISINFSYCKSSHHWKNTEKIILNPKLSDMIMIWVLQQKHKTYKKKEKVISQISAVVWLIILLEKSLIADLLQVKKLFEPNDRSCMSER